MTNLKKVIPRLCQANVKRTCIYRNVTKTPYCRSL